jgi:hypothetical protein
MSQVIDDATIEFALGALPRTERVVDDRSAPVDVRSAALRPLAAPGKKGGIGLLAVSSNDTAISAPRRRQRLSLTALRGLAVAEIELDQERSITTAWRSNIGANGQT